MAKLVLLSVLVVGCAASVLAQRQSLLGNPYGGYGGFARDLSSSVSGSFVSGADLVRDLRRGLVGNNGGDLIDLGDDLINLGGSQGGGLGADLNLVGSQGGGLLGGILGGGNRGGNARGLSASGSD